MLGQTLIWELRLLRRHNLVDFRYVKTRRVNDSEWETNKSGEDEGCYVNIKRYRGSSRHNILDIIMS